MTAARLYIAGPMSNLPELNFPAFHAEAARLRALGYEIVNPAEINSDPTAGWLACMRADIKQLVDCDGIALLPGWERSKGASLERIIATGLGLLVVDAEHLVYPAASAEEERAWLEWSAQRQGAA